MNTARDTLTAFNDRIKLFAGFLNAIAIGLIGFAVLRPLTESLSNASLYTLWWAVSGLIIHALAHFVLRRVRREIKE